MLLSYIEAIGHSDLLPSWVPDWTGEGLFQGSLAATYSSYEDILSMQNPVIDRRIIPRSVSCRHITPHSPANSTDMRLRGSNSSAQFSTKLPKQSTPFTT